ncbi:MAG: OmpA family protein [Gammaproteobacteria bacterium]
MVASVLSCVGLVGCTTDPYTGERKASKAAIGAAVGAAVGVATSSKSDRKKGAVIGAVVGGSAGAYMDNQERKLRERLQGTGVSVTRDGSNIYLNMPGNLTFEVDSSNIRSSFYEVLESVNLVFKEFKNTQIQISGHTDSSGSDSYNKNLSEQRANSVLRYFTAKGLSASRFYAVGYGESRPIADNATPEGRARNRRVEIEIVPAGV